MLRAYGGPVTLWFLVLSFLFLSSLLVPNQSLAQDPFVLIQLRNGISFQLPRNWRVFQSTTRTTLEASVAARVQIDIGSALPFAANLYDEGNQTIGMVNIRVYPDLEIYQDSVMELDADSVNAIDMEIRSAVSEGVTLSGGRVTHWFGTEKVRVNQKFYLLSKYRRRSITNPNQFFRVSLLRLWDGKQSFTLTLSYAERHEFLLKPIIAKIGNSVSLP